MRLSCIECGASVPRRATERGGNQPGFCSDECRRQRKAKTYQQWVEINRDRKLAVDAECRARRKKTHPDYFKQFYAKHREQRKREAGTWYHANAERALENRRIYVTLNRDRVRIWGRKRATKRRVLKQQLFVEDVDPLVVFERDKGVCGICRTVVDKTSKWEIDHIVPLSKRGPHSYANVQLAHMRCNRRKNNRL